MGFDLCWPCRDVTLGYIYVHTNALCHDKSLIVGITWCQITLLNNLHKWNYLMLSSLAHSKSYHMFSYYIINIVINVFESLARLLQFLILKHEKLTIGYILFWLLFFWLHSYMFIVVNCKVFNIEINISLSREYKGHHVALDDLDTKYVMEITFIRKISNLLLFIHVTFILFLTIMPLSTL